MLQITCLKSLATVGTHPTVSPLATTHGAMVCVVADAHGNQVALIIEHEPGVTEIVTRDNSRDFAERLALLRLASPAEIQAAAQPVPRLPVGKLTGFSGT